MPELPEFRVTVVMFWGRRVGMDAKPLRLLSAAVSCRALELVFEGIVSHIALMRLSRHVWWVDG